MKYVGIDLGTTNTLCCFAEDAIQFIPMMGKDMLPSSLLFLNGSVTVGERAKKKGVAHSEHLIESAKTFLADADKVWRIDGRDFTSTDAAVEVLKTVKSEAEKFFKSDEILSAVVTIPAYFSSSQRRETKEAAEAAGFCDVRIIHEPVAAAIAYGLDRSEDNTIFVIDFGGGTFDVCVMKKKRGEYEPLVASGDRRLGGDDFTEVIRELCFKKIRVDYGIDLSDEVRSGLDGRIFKQARNALMLHSEKAKIDLSDAESTEIIIPDLIRKSDGNINFEYTITRNDFMDAAGPLFNKIKRIISDYMDDVNMEASDIDRVILVGGSSNIPAVREHVKKYFKQEPYADKDTSKLVAMGAAIYAIHKGTGIVTIKDKLSHSIGVRVKIGEDKYGYSTLLNRGDEYPTKYPVSKMYTTTVDNQNEIPIHIFEGDDTDVRNNRYYGGFLLDGIQQAKKGVPNIEVSFLLDDDMILHVDAEDKSTKASVKKKLSLSEKKIYDWDEADSNVSIYFVIDVTGSMEPYINGVKDTCFKFENTIHEKADSVELGLVVLGMKK